MSGQADYGGAEEKEKLLEEGNKVFFEGRRKKQNNPMKRGSGFEALGERPCREGKSEDVAAAGKSRAKTIHRGIRGLNFLK